MKTTSEIVLQTLTRQPFSILGAVALLSLGDDLVNLHGAIEGWLDAWQSVTRPFWDFVVGRVFQWVGWEMPIWLKDYLSVGLVVFGMNLRSRLYEVSEDPSAGYVRWHLGPFPLFTYHQDNRLVGALCSVLDIIEALALWPGIVVGRIHRAMTGNEMAKRKLVVFLETLVWVLLVIALSHALMSYGA